MSKLVSLRKRNKTKKKASKTFSGMFPAKIDFWQVGLVARCPSLTYLTLPT